MTSKKDNQDYQTLTAELDGILSALQMSDVRVDEAAALYERGLKLITQLEAYVLQTENKLQKLRLVTGELSEDKD